MVRTCYMGELMFLVTHDQRLNHFFIFVQPPTVEPK